MRYLLLITLLLSLGCSSTQRQNRQLRLSKKHLALAVALGAKMDSVKTTVKEDVTVSGIHDVESKEKDVNVGVLDSLCLELRRQLDSIKRGNGNVWCTLTSQKPNLHPGAVEFVDFFNPNPTVKKIQKTVCPNEKKDTTYHQKIIIDGKEYDNPIHIIASSIAGHASLQVDAKPLTIPYTKETVQVNATPSNEPTMFGKILRYAGVLLIGLIIGFILGKVFKFGVNL